MLGVGPASACKIGINVIADTYGASPFRMKNVALFMGAASYALAFDGDVNIDYIELDNIDIGHYDAYPIFSSCARPHDGIGFLMAGNAPNVVDALIYITGLTGVGIYMEGGLNHKYRGSIEACGTAIKVRGTDEISTRPWCLDLDNLNIGDNNVIGLDIDAVNNTTIGDCLIYGDSTISRVRHCKIHTTDFNKLTIKSDVVSVSFDEVSIQGTDAFICDAQAAHFVTPMRVSQQSDIAYPGSMPQLKNHIENSGFDRWTASIMSGWSDADGTYTKCGTGLGDTTRHIAAYSAKVNTNGHANIGCYYKSFSGALLNDLLGKFCSASLWIKPTATGATAPTLFIDCTIAAWASGTAYKINDFVKDATSTYTFKCVTAGTSGGSEPTWSTKYQYHTSDNGIVWIRENCANYSRGISATFTNGIWSQISTSCQVPQNATAVSVYFYLYQAAGSVDVDYYIAEPCLTNGGAPRQFVQSHGEFSKVLWLNGVAFVADSYPPDNGSSEYNTGYYFPKGSACLNKAAASGSAPGGWTCTTAGAPGTWKAWANLP